MTIFLELWTSLTNYEHIGPRKTCICFFIPTFEEDNNPDFTQDGYGLCNFTLGWRYQPKKVYYEISAFGKNIFDEKYIIDAGNSGRQIGFPTYVGGSRSVIGAQFKIGF